MLKGQVNRLMENDIRMQCDWKDCEVTELNLQENHIHLKVPMPPKVSILKLTCILKGNLAIKLFMKYSKLKEKPYRENHFWARGYFVSIKGLDEEMIGKYKQHQESEEKEAEIQ